VEWRDVHQGSEGKFWPIFEEEIRGF
jgi:hypothetical protein